MGELNTLRENISMVGCAAHYLLQIRKIRIVWGELTTAVFCRSAAVEDVEVKVERECAVAAEHLKYVAEGGPAGKALMDAYWAHWDGRSWSALIGYAWGTALGFDLAHAGLAQLLSDTAPLPSSVAMDSRAMLGCPADISKGNDCDRTRVALLRRLVSPRARQGDSAPTPAGADEVAVGRWLPVEAIVALAEVAMSVAQEPGVFRNSCVASLPIVIHLSQQRSLGIGCCCCLLACGRSCV